MKWGNVGPIGGIVLAAYLIIVGASLLFGMAIPGWFVGIIAAVAGVLILIGR